VNNASKTNIRLKIVNFFGSVGYLACVFQWLWAILLYFSLIEGYAKSITPASEVHNTSPVSSPINISSPDILQVLVVLAITVVMVAITIYIIIKMPSIVSNTSRKIVHQAADNIAPVVMQAQKKPFSKRNQQKLSSKIIIFLKVLLVFAPVIASIFSKLLDKQIMEFYLVMIVTFWLASFSIVFFSAQYLFSWLFKVRNQDVW